MKVRKFQLSDAPTPTDMSERIMFAIGADHGYAEACKEHQELVDALEACLTQLEIVLPSSGRVHDEIQAIPKAKSLLAKYKGESPKPVEYSWECNQCGSQEYTMEISEDDVHELGCSHCGGDEWHKAVSR